jgi:RNA polymerase sigma-70 factor (ECF subfamily)
MMLEGHPEPTSGLPSPEKLAESAEVWREVHSAIKLIEPAYREVLVLRDIEGLSAKQVAEIVGLSVGAVKSRLHRARAQLRSNLAPSSYQPKPGCPDIRKVFSRHLEGELSSEICSEMQAHVSQCDDCANECNGLRQALFLCTESSCDVPKNVQVKVQLALRKVLSEQPQ